MTDEVVLYDYWRSSASYRVRIALNLANIDYRAVPVDLVGGAQRSAQHLSRNPQGFVPVLEIDGHSFTQSLAILDYLDETRALSLLPNTPTERARVRALSHALAVDLHPVCNLSVAAHARDLTGGGAEAMKAWMQHFIRPGLLAFESLLSGFDQAPYCCGETPTLADLCLMPQMYNARRWEVSLEGLERLLGAEAACAKHPAFAAAHPDRHAP